MIRVAIVDDQELVRGGVAMVVNSQADLEVAWQAADGVEALARQADDPVDIVVMDVRMPAMDGIEATKRIVATGDTRVLILTTFDLDEYALDGLRAGASGFLLKDAPGEEVVAAVRHVQGGDQVLAPATTRRLLEQFVVPARLQGARWDLRDLLTERELDVVRLVTRGATNAEIAGELYLAETTVKTHIRAVLRKINGRDRVHIVIAAYESGFT